MTLQRHLVENCENSIPVSETERNRGKLEDRIIDFVRKDETLMSRIERLKCAFVF